MTGLKDELAKLADDGSIDKLADRLAGRHENVDERRVPYSPKRRGRRYHYEPDPKRPLYRIRIYDE
jgi:hypothetical protein